MTTILSVVAGGTASLASRLATFGYSVGSYLIGCAALGYLILFIADLFVPVTLVSASQWSPAIDGAAALIWNLVLITLWGAQHTIMARPAFKRIWTRWVPAAIERSTYLIFVAAATAMLVIFWVPMPYQIWDLSGSITGSIVLAVYFFGWAVVLFATFLINHFALFGLSQAWPSSPIAARCKPGILVQRHNRIEARLLVHVG